MPLRPHARRLGEGGDPRKGPTAVGVRLQDTLRVGPFKLEACASKVAVQVRGRKHVNDVDMSVYLSRPRTQES